MEKERSTIYVSLVNEGTDVWRPVSAEQLREHVYRIVSVNHDPEDEEWQFQTGDIVRCRTQVFSGGETGLVAVEVLPAAI
jgi:hypothetical protein